MQFIRKKNLFNFITHPFFIKMISFRFSLDAFKNFILTNFVLKHTEWSNYEKSYNNNLNNETKL